MQHQDMTLARRADRRTDEAVGLERFAVGHAEVVRLAPHRVDEIAILAHEGITLRLLHGAALAHVYHQLELRQLDDHPLA